MTIEMTTDGLKEINSLYHMAATHEKQPNA